MKQKEVDLHLQTLFRNKSKTHTEALAVFYTFSKQDDLFPEIVETPKAGTWKLREAHSYKQMDMKYKTYAIYDRTLETKEDEVLA